MENLKKAVHNKVPKNVDVLHLAALATRNMNGKFIFDVSNLHLTRLLDTELESGVL